MQGILANVKFASLKTENQNLLSFDSLLHTSMNDLHARIGFQDMFELIQKIDHFCFGTQLVFVHGFVFGCREIQRKSRGKMRVFIAYGG